MADILYSVFDQKKQTLVGMQQNRRPWWNAWRDLADYLLPSRYNWLLSKPEQVAATSMRNSKILDSTGTRAARTLAAGMMNGITSPARPWFKLRLADFKDDLSMAARMWLDEVERRMSTVMAESNFYNSLAVLYLDLSVFGTANMLIYEDYEKVIHCHNNALGEFYLMADAQRRVCGMAREQDWTIYQIVQEFGEENCSDGVRDAYKAGGSRLLETRRIVHLIEPNDQRDGAMAPGFAYREYYWEEGASTPTINGKVRILRAKGYIDFPGICPRWELTGSEVYGVSPGMDALGDVIQLQHETKKKAQGIDKMISPPMLADISMEGRSTGMLPNSVTYVARLDNGSGMRPAYQVNVPLNDMMLDIQDVRRRIGETFFNFLFNDIQQLDTVRSATEIQARREEKLILLGPVLERFENECLDPAIRRIFGIMVRNKLLPAPPPEIAGANLTIQYTSILASAQSAVGTVPTERLLQVIGSLVGVFPEAKLIPNIPELLTDYARDIGVKAKNVHSLEEIKATIAAQNQQAQQQLQLANAGQAAQAAETLSNTDVGGGANALQKVLGNA